MTTSARSAALLVALASLGCSAVVDPEGYDPVASAEGFCNSIQDALADLPCGTADAALDQQFAYLRTGCDTLQAAVDGGRFTYDSGSAAACIDAIERLGCRGMFNMGAMATFEWPQPCRDALRGRVPAGGACSYDEWSGARQGVGQYTLSECVEGAGCYASMGGDGVCGDTCEHPAGYLESCYGGRPCQEGFVCAANLDYKCHYGTTGDSCNYSWSDCAPGYFCTLSPGGTCQVAAPAGQPCSLGSYCSTDSYCDYGTATCVAKVGYGGDCSSKPCQDGLNCFYDSAYGTYACTYFAQEGQSCALANCDNNAQPSLYCDAAQICRRYPAEPLPRGASCWNLGTAYCADGLFCDTYAIVGTLNTCQPQLGPGGDCPGGMGYELCRPGTYCDSMATYTCVALGGPGADCNTLYSTTCQNGLYCRTEGMTSYGVCDTLPTDGERCASSGMSLCAPGHYMTYPPPNGYCVCARALEVGDACFSDDQCGYGTGLRCDPGFGTCQLRYTCEVPIGWLPVGGP